VRHNLTPIIADSSNPCVQEPDGGKEFAYPSTDKDSLSGNDVFPQPRIPKQVQSEKIGGRERETVTGTVRIGCEMVVCTGRSRLLPVSLVHLPARCLVSLLSRHTPPRRRQPEMSYVV
jgi:hypothetical protein